MKGATRKKPAPKKAAPARKKPGKVGTSQAAAEARKLRFVEAMIATDDNITQAAVMAGFSARSAAQQGSRLLKDAKVQQLLKDRRAALLSKLELTSESVLRSLAQSVFFDPRKLYRVDGTLKDVHELDDDTAMALAGLEVTEEMGPAPVDTELEPQPHGGGLKRQQGRKVLRSITAKVKWHDKTAAREQAMKHLGLFKADNTQRTLLGDVPRDKLKAIVARLAGG
jgi:phage terminase small subunit